MQNKTSAVPSNQETLDFLIKIGIGIRNDIGTGNKYFKLKKKTYFILSLLFQISRFSYYFKGNEGGGVDWLGIG